MLYHYEATFRLRSGLTMVIAFRATWTCARTVAWSALHAERGLSARDGIELVALVIPSRS